MRQVLQSRAKFKHGVEIRLRDRLFGLWPVVLKSFNIHSLTLSAEGFSIGSKEYPCLRPCRTSRGCAHFLLTRAIRTDSCFQGNATYLLHAMVLLVLQSGTMLATGEDHTPYFFLFGSGETSCGASSQMDPSELGRLMYAAAQCGL